MALATYSDLQAAIAAWMDRTDLAGVIPDFIALFETTATTELSLRTRYNLATETLTTVANIATVDLPSDFLEAKALINQTDPKEIVAFATPTSLYTGHSSAAAGRPTGFTYVGNHLELAPTPDAAYTLKLYYYQKALALSSTNTTNWLLTSFPNLYLFGSLIAAEAYLGTDPRLGLWRDLYSDLVMKLQAASDRGQYGGASLTARTDAVA